MTTFEAFVKRHPMLSYFILTFVISWGGILLVAGGPGAIPGTSEEVGRLFPIALLLNETGPMLAGILMTGLVYGRAGLRELLSRLLRWQVGARWYALALLTAPLLVTATLFALLPTSPVFLPGIIASTDRAGLLLAGIGVGLFGGFFEEPGWTGFATPELRRRYSSLTTGLIVGVAWGVWHFLATFWSTGDSSGAPLLPLLLPPLLFYVAVLPVFRVLMVWVYDRTGSLLVAVLMHATLIASTLFVLAPLAIPAVPLMTWYVVLGAVLWIVVAALARLRLLDGFVSACYAPGIEFRSGHPQESTS